MSNNEIQLVPEIMGTAAGLLETDAAINAFKTDPKDFLKKVLDADMTDVKLSVVENGGNEMNLCLPYYSTVAEGAMHDDSLTGVVGGMSAIEFTRNRQQFDNNCRLALMGRPSSVNNNYDGTFNEETDATWFPHQTK